MAQRDISPPELARLMACGDATEEKKLRERIPKWRLGAVANPQGDDMRKLCAALGVFEQWMRSGEGPRDRTPSEKVIDAGKVTDLSQNLANSDVQPVRLSGGTIPIRGRGMAGVEGVRFFPDDGDIVGETEAPPGTAVEGAYAVRVFGRSMKPVYDPGDLVCVNPHQTAEPGDKVVVQISTDGGVTIEVFIKRLVSLDDKRLIVEQFNPPDQMRWPREHVVAVHRIIWGGPGPGG